MTIRRLFALLLFAVWLAPAAAAGGVALHLAFDHPGADPAPSTIAVSVLTHGHDHPDGAAEHAHLAALSAAPALRSGWTEDGRSVVDALFALASRGADLLTATAARRPLAPPGPAHGPDLLALLSLLRI